MTVEQVEEARRLWSGCQWQDLVMHLDARRDELGPQEWEWLAVAAGLTAADDLAEVAWEESHRAWLAANDVPRAVRCAFWLAMSLMRRDRRAPAGGWFGRARRLLDESGIECAESGRLLIPEALALLGSDPAAALERFEQVAAIGSDHGDAEVAAFGRLGSGQARVQLGDATGGVALMDEAMAAATSGDVIPIGVGIIYCAVILECHRIFDIRRAREWTAEFDRWSSAQQGLVPFRGQCLVHRSEVAQLRGDWDAAVVEADSACSHLSDPAGDPALGLALHQRADLHRLRGEFEAAVEAYRQAEAMGRRVAPGPQLLLLAQGRTTEAARSLQGVLDEASGPVQRARLLGAQVQVLLASHDVDGAGEAVTSLAALAGEFGTPMLQATADWNGACHALAVGDAEGAVAAATRARTTWQELAVPYEVARANAVIAKACRAVDDTAAAQEAHRLAEDAFRELGAAPDLAALAATGARAPGDLSPRELEVVALLATGLTNREIAERLVISQKTVARHVSNIFVKIGVSTRTAAGAWAHQHGITTG